MKIKKNLIIIGMMGSGKSTIGSILAKNLDFEFIDTDTEIEKKESMKIVKIFKDYGEKYFRKIEEKIILETLQQFFPNASYITEESNEIKGDDETIVIDPIDGTSNFI